MGWALCAAASRRPFRLTSGSCAIRPAIIAMSTPAPDAREQMTRAVAEQVIKLVADSPTIGSVDLTGGAPELNGNFRYLMESARALGRHVMVRCNLTVLFAGGMEWLPSSTVILKRNWCVHCPAMVPTTLSSSAARASSSKASRPCAAQSPRIWPPSTHATSGLQPGWGLSPPAQAQLETALPRGIGRAGS